jgi:hypothetical protein
MRCQPEISRSQERRPAGGTHYKVVETAIHSGFKGGQS